MSRELKFRAFDLIDKKMHFVMSIWGFPKTEDITIPFEDTCNTLFNNFELMQFTGLTDLNGTEIYEGDIIAYSYREKQGDETVRIVKEKGHEVVYKNGCFFLNNEPLGYEWEEDKFVECDTQKWATVIGNIYENSELI